MKTTKLFLAALVIVSLPMTLFSQLSDRVNSPSTYMLGTRPVAGNLSIQAGTSYQDVQDILDPNKDFETLPIVSIKYYSSNTNVFTVSLKTSKEKINITGVYDAVPADDFKYLSNESQFMLVPGFERHFGHNNILDVFVGARVPFGLDKNILEQVSGPLSYKATKNNLAFGLDALIGIQAFIGDLPFAIGAEVNYSYLGRLGNQYKVETSGGVGGDRTYYYTDVDNPVINPLDQFSELQVNEATIEGDFRLSLVYFFRR